MISIALALTTSACILPPTGLAAARQTAADFNQDSRLGDETVLAQVVPAERDAYVKRHRAWGTDIKVADVEVLGVKPHGDAGADVYVHVAWYRVQDEELRSTVVKQGWRSKSDGWQLEREERSEGDVGLLGEQVVVEAPPAPRQPAQFPTIRLGESPTE